MIGKYMMDRKPINDMKSLLERMTIPEKVAQLTSCWFYELQTEGELDMQKVQSRFENGIGQITRMAGASTLTPTQAARTANILQKQLLEHSRLGIPAIIHEECCSGSMVLGGSIFPQIIGLASTFRPELAGQMTSEIRKQLRSIGAHQGLAPVLDVARDPRWGRVEETFGEDPILISQFGVEYIRGLQSDDLKKGIVATAKHFVGHSLSMGGLNCAPVMLGKRTLWDTYLLPFQAAIRDAGLVCMMNSYPELDGEVVSTSREILTDLLRGQLGFDGLIVSDYESIRMIHNYFFAASSPLEAAKIALRAGIEVELPTVECFTKEFEQAVEDGQVPMEWIDQAVKHHLEMKSKLGLFEKPYVDEGRVIEIFETPDQRKLAGEIARQSMVLLTNDGMLPLSKSIRKVAVIGPNADDWRNMLGDYAYPAMGALLVYNKPDHSNFKNLDMSTLINDQVRVPTVLESIRAKIPAAQVDYARGCDTNSDDISGFDEAIRIAKQADAVILVLGDRSGLTPECTCGETRDSSDLHLPGVQPELAKTVIATGKPVVVVLINGRPLAVPDLASSANSILEAWLPGEEGGPAITDVLFGEVNPGGKLAMTFPRSVGQVPIFYNHKPSGSTALFYTDYVSESVKPLFPFGHGLSYSTFEYSDFSISSQQAEAGDVLDITCNVKNTSNRAGDEVVQLYCRDVYASIPRPVKELDGFIRLSLQPGQTRQVRFHLPVDILAFHNVNFDLVLEPGKIEVMIGSSSADIRLQGSFEIGGSAPVMVQERVYICPVDIT